MKIYNFKKCTISEKTALKLSIPELKIMGATDEEIKSITGRVVVPKKIKVVEQVQPEPIPEIIEETPKKKRKLK